MRTLRTLSILLLVGFLAASAVEAADRWLHVRVEEHDGDNETVRVNVPLDVVERMLPLIDADELRGGKLHLDWDDEFEDLNLRELLLELSDAPDAEYVTVESDDESVRVAKENGYLVIRAEDRGRRSSEKVLVRMPLTVVEALAGDDPHELDLLAALRALGDHQGEDLVFVESDDTTVRVWIDTSESGR